MNDVPGWLGLPGLVLAGVGCGVTWAALAPALLVDVAGLILVAGAFLRGYDLPLVLGVPGALGAVTIMVFSRQKEPERVGARGPESRGPFHLPSVW